VQIDGGAIEYGQSVVIGGAHESVAAAGRRKKKILLAPEFVHDLLGELGPTARKAARLLGLLLAVRVHDGR